MGGSSNEKMKEEEEGNSDKCASVKFESVNEQKAKQVQGEYIKNF